MVRCAEIITPPKKQDKEFQIIGISLTIKELTTFIISHVERWHQKNIYKERVKRRQFNFTAGWVTPACFPALHHRSKRLCHTLYICRI
ncbi:hypothetical protein GH097_14975 [Escherichia coli]|nr:hypothetical protein [Escherichia coli]